MADTYFKSVQWRLAKQYETDGCHEEAVAILNTTNYESLVELLEEYHEESCNAALEVIHALVDIQTERTG